MSAPKEVIDWVNEGRSILGLEPLDDLRKGNSESASCPIANSLTDCYSEYYAYVCDFYIVIVDAKLEWSYCSILAIQPVRQFIRDFDDGLYPEYMV